MSVAGGTAEAPRYLLSRRATQLAFAGLMLGMLLAALTQTIVATATPQIVEDLAGVEQYSWIFIAYTLAATISTPVWGRLSDIHGRRPLLLAGIVALIAGSLVATITETMTQLIAARALQGLGSGALIPVALATIGDLVPASERGRWSGLYGGALAFASVTGPLLGGWIVDHASWRWVFLVNVPFAMLAFVACAIGVRVPPHPDRATRVDWAGATLLTAALGGVLLAIVQVRRAADIGEPTILVPGLAGLSLAVALVAQQRTSAEPFIPVALLRNRLVRLVNIAVFLVGASMFVTIMFVPLLAQGVLGVSATQSGLVLMPLMLALFLTSLVSGRSISRTGRYRWIVVAGAPTTGLGFGLLAQIDEHSGTSALAISTIVVGLGLGFLWQNLVIILQNGVPERDLGLATSATQLFRNTGGTLGVTVVGALLSAGAAASAAAGTSVVGDTVAARADLADAIRPAFLLLTVLMVAASWVIVRVPELPLATSTRASATEAVADRGAASP